MYRTDNNAQQTNTTNDPKRQGSVTVTHNDDGTLTIPVYFYTAVFTSNGYKNYGGDWELDRVPVKVTITSAENFNDESSPTIAYSNLSGNAVTLLQAAITDLEGYAYAYYRDIPITGSTYKFTLTETELNKLYEASLYISYLAFMFS